MEIPDAIILNKCDAETEARRAYHALRASLSLSRPGEEDRIKIHRTSATTGQGLDAIAHDILAIGGDPLGRTMARKERYFLEKWARDEFGRTGLRYLAGQEGGTEALLAGTDFESAQLQLRADYAQAAATFIQPPE